MSALNLGPYFLLIKGRIVGSADNLSLDVAEATHDEIDQLKAAHEFTLRKAPQVQHETGEQ